MIVAYIEKYENFEQFFENAIKKQNNTKNSKNLFRLIDIEYFTSVFSFNVINMTT